MAHGNDLIPVLRMTMRLLEEKRYEQDSKAAAEHRSLVRLGESLDRMRAAEDAEHALGILHGPAERTYTQALDTVGAVLDFRETLKFLKTRDHGLEAIPKPDAPKAEPPHCQYCETVCWTRAAYPLCLECWTYFAKYFSGADPGPDRCAHSDPEAPPMLPYLFPLDAKDT